MIQTATEIIENGNKRKYILGAYTQLKRTGMRVACVYHDMFFGFRVAPYSFLKSEKYVNLNRKKYTWIFCKRMKLKLCIE